MILGDNVFILKMFASWCPKVLGLSIFIVWVIMSYGFGYGNPSHYDCVRIA